MQSTLLSQMRDRVDGSKAAGEDDGHVLVRRESSVLREVRPVSCMPAHATSFAQVCLGCKFLTISLYVPISQKQ